MKEPSEGVTSSIDIHVDCFDVLPPKPMTAIIFGLIPREFDCDIMDISISASATTPAGTHQTIFNCSDLGAELPEFDVYVFDLSGALSATTGVTKHGNENKNMFGFNNIGIGCVFGVVLYMNEIDLNMNDIFECYLKKMFCRACNKDNSNHNRCGSHKSKNKNKNNVQQQKERKRTEKDTTIATTHKLTTVTKKIQNHILLLIHDLLIVLNMIINEGVIGLDTDNVRVKETGQNTSVIGKDMMQDMEI